jgi:hypothetical protein
MSSPTFNPFLMGCIGALAPEIIRIYNLRLSPTLRWSWSYLLFSFPFILLGGFMAYILEPTTSYAAFYTGVSTPFIVTTLVKDSEHDARAIRNLAQDQERIKAELSHLQQRSPIPSVESDHASGHSALRGTGQASSDVFPTSMNHTTNRYSPRSLSRRFRHRPLLAKGEIFQAFLRAL